MKQKNLFIVFIIILMSHLVATAQNQVPPALKSAIPSRYKITYELYSKADFIVGIEIKMEIPSKNGCDSNKDLYPPTEVSLSVDLINNSQIAKMLEEQMPFSKWLPTKESHKPQIDTWDELIKYSETTLVELSGGRAVYYTWTQKCIQSENIEYSGVSLTSLFGSHSAKIGIGINGNIDASEAVGILKELHGIFSNFNFQNL